MNDMQFYSNYLVHIPKWVCIVSYWLTKLTSWENSTPLKTHWIFSNYSKIFKGMQSLAMAPLAHLNIQYDLVPIIIP